MAELEREHQTLQGLLGSLHGPLTTAAEVRRLARKGAVFFGPLGRLFEPGRAVDGSPPVRRPYREFLSASGRAILVGRGGPDNHALTFQHASPHDVWLHARGFPGSHVVIPLHRRQEPDHETLTDAAHLAVHFSKAPGRGFSEVMWTRRKHVRAIRKGRPGQVTVHDDSNLAFEFDDERLARLLRTRPGPH